MMRTRCIVNATACLAAGALVALAQPALAYCKYKAADGSWTFSQNCARMTNQAIDGSGTAVIRENESLKKPPPRLESRRLKGYDYSTSTHSGMRIRMVEPTKPPAESGGTSQ